MNQLKFSHNYLKLPPNWEHKKATLLFVREIELEKQTEAFLSFDTEYIDKMIQDSFGSPEPIYERYPLPSKGKYLLLLFECEDTIFTELRTPTKEHKAKYSHVGEEFWEEFELVKVDEK